MTIKELNYIRDLVYADVLKKRESYELSVKIARRATQSIYDPMKAKYIDVEDEDLKKDAADKCIEYRTAENVLAKLEKYEFR